MHIYGMVKTSLVDYPGHLATTLFTGGCNMRCPFCHNKDLVLQPGALEVIQEKEVLELLEKRKGSLEAVCITGGEPTLSKDLMEFIKAIKAYSVKIKLDTNGLNPTALYSLLDAGLLDYVAMDIKNTRGKYALTSGYNGDPLPFIQSSIEMIQTASIPYEFRTTTLKEFHTPEDFLEIAQWLKGSKRYALQKYQYQPHQIKDSHYTAFNFEEITAIKAQILPFFDEIITRGY